METDNEMEASTQMSMGNDTFIQINAPLIALNIVANAFYILSMVCPLHGKRIKQPLKILLWSLICSTGTYLMSLCLIFVLEQFTEDFKLINGLCLVANCSFYSSITSSVWQNFFYYTQIVPAQRAFFIWIKKNIKSIIYCILVVERLYILFYFILFVVLFLSYSFRFDSSSNFTMSYDKFMPKNMDWLKNICVILDFTQKGHFIFCFCLMVKSSVSTVVYLSRHMRHMVTNGQTLLCPQLRSQLRVTATGILQGIMSVFFALWYTYDALSDYVGFSSVNVYVTFTVINLYMAGTTFNLGAGQAVFRERAAHIWTIAAQWCRRQI